MVRRGALERCETGANPLETKGKRKPVTPENDPRETGLSFLNGGGGGSRTPVREHSTRSIYRLRSSMAFTVLMAPDQAQDGNPAGNLLAEDPGGHRSLPA